MAHDMGLSNTAASFENARQILLVEDSATHAALITDAFASTDTPLHLSVATTLEEARKSIANQLPNLLLADLLLPDGRGTELLPDLAEDAPYPVVILTSHGDEQVAVEAMKHGAIDYVVKSAQTLSHLPQICERALRDWEHIAGRREAEKRLKRALEKVRKDRARLDAILQSVGDGLLVTDEQNRIIQMSMAAESMLGISHHQAIGQPVERVIPYKDLVEKISLAALGQETGEPTDWPLPTSDPQAPRIVQIRTSLARNRENQTIGVITLLQEVTREREIERMRNQFISTAAHELQTPLTAIIGYSDLLLHQDEYGVVDEAQQREYHSYICSKAERLSGIVDDMLDLSRLQAGKTIPLDKAVCRIDTLVEQAVAPCRGASSQHRFEVELDPACPTVTADCQRVVQVLENLLSNAVKYSPRGGPIHIRSQVTGERLQVTVSDQGLGMTRDEVDRIFDYFYRVDSSNTAKGGLGLGMAVVRSIIEAHGGSISIDSEPDRGTAVSFTLPLSPTGPEPCPP